MNGKMEKQGIHGEKMRPKSERITNAMCLSKKISFHIGKYNGTTTTTTTNSPCAQNIKRYARFNALNEINE